MIWKRESVTTWGRTCFSESLVGRPENHRDLLQYITDNQDQAPIIAYGAGRSYGDAPLNTNKKIIKIERLNRIIEFDPASGLLLAEPGLTFLELLKVFGPKGFLIPVSPGTSFATIGGAVANDVHGKNQETAGCFGHHLEWLELMTPNGKTIRVSEKENPEIYKSTIGGIGLTGIITLIAVKLKKISSSYLERKYIKTKDLEHSISTLLDISSSKEYSVGWIDLLNPGKGLGRGIIELASHSKEDNLKEVNINLKPLITGNHNNLNFWPNGLLNKYSGKLLNSIYYQKVSTSANEHLVKINDFLYPLDKLRSWNKLYGPAGFYQFQCVVPIHNSEKIILDLIYIAEKYQAPPILSVIKVFGLSGLGCLSFAKPGITIALDFPGKSVSNELFEQLTTRVISEGGRIYLAKDAKLTPEQLGAMYPELNVMKQTLSRYGLDGFFASDMSNRLEIN
ncbi:MAG: FAD-dependent decaprenylphosphoryl-beta-D-ribofuranose 2-oxidase [Alphaproteobacteria bacterium MarineAlpha3_Bin7]|nr:MAG: FAD-dependent decaprenylphosphoryl-beta-D-ribofuranose 2-oxidase [Alphaproteobacteria bacterium MarineAlpha3_Bin7]|tara:strand:+ start:2901 stop:4256 length:1356 start_codon:yes stop_codon:yes gene_type:complete